MRAAGLILAACLLAACAAAPDAAATRAPAPQPFIALPPELDRVLRDYERGWQAGDADALAALFTEDGFVLSNGALAVRGRDAIRAAYAGAHGDLQLRALAFATGADEGHIVGAFWYGAQPAPERQGKFVLVLQRGGGRWLIAADIDNSSHWQR